MKQGLKHMLFLLCASYVLVCVIFFVMEPAFAANLNCSFSGGTVVNFANYDPLNTSPLTTSGTITVSCKGFGRRIYLLTISLGQSPNTSAFNPRAMIGATYGDLLDYNIYLDPAMTLIWGDGTNGTFQAQTIVFGPRSAKIPYYGKIPPNQDVYGGETFTDTLTATLFY